MKTRSAVSHKIREIIVFAMLGTIMFVSKQLLEGLPNFHMLGMLIMTYTIVYRVKALIPIYVFVFLEGVYVGFQLWWIPYLYIWAVLWGMTMLLPKNMPRDACVIVYPLVCALHGMLYGTLYSPFQWAVFLNFDFRAQLNWIVAGLPWDAVHAAGNFVMGILVYPVSRLLLKLEAKNPERT